MQSVTVVTPATQEPVTVAEALAHCRVDHAGDNALLAGLIAAARKRVETTTRRALMLQTLLLSLDRFPRGEILLPRPPAIEIVAIDYVDVDGVDRQLEEYQLSAASEPARLVPAYGASWPATRCQPAAVGVTWRAGYATAALVPPTTKLAILQLVAHWYVHRESATDETTLSETPQSVDFLLAGERVFQFA